MKVTLMAYSHNSKVTGAKKAMQTVAKNRFLTLIVSQIGKMNVKNLKRASWFVAVKITEPNTVTA
jgi:predicted Fe-Mo cluster-binding NifX family protein